MRPTRTITALSILLLGAFTVLADIPPCGWSESFSATYMPGGIDFVNFIFATEDNSGNVISVGGFKGTVSFGGQTNLTSFNNSANDIFIVKFDPVGNLLWGQVVGSTNADQAYGVATDSSGNIFVAGLYHGPVNFGVSNATAAVGTFLAKYNPGGICQWVNTIIGKPLSTIGHPVAVDSSGNPIIVAFDTVFKYASTTGAQLWATNVGGFGQAIAIDGNGDAFVAGYFSGTATIGTNSFISAGADDCFVAKVYGANGYSGWSKAGGGTLEDTFRGIAVDQNSNVVAVGQFTGTATYSGSNIVSQYSAGIVVSKYNGANGNLMFLRGLGPFSYTGSSAANSVCVDKNNNVFVTGIVTGGVDFGGGNSLGDGSGNVFIANFDDTTCNTVYAYQYGAVGPDTGSSISAGTGNIVMAGTFASGIDFGCGAMSDPFFFTQNGEYYGFLVKFQVKTYFVDPVSGNDANPGTAMNLAWQHIPGSLQGGTNYLSGSGWVEIDDGNTIVVKGGSTNYCQVQFMGSGYNGSQRFDSILVQSGHLYNPPWGTGRAIFDEGNTNTWGFAIGAGSGPAVYGLTLDGFEIRNIAAGAAGAPWDTCRGSACIELGTGDINSVTRYISVKRCWLHDAQRKVLPCDANGDDLGHGMEVACRDVLIYYNQVGPGIGTKGIEVVRSGGGAISNNFIIGTGDHSMALSGTNFDVCNNLIIGFTNGVHSPVYSIGVAGATNCDIWNNVVFQQQPAPAPTSSQDWQNAMGFYSGASGVRVINNTLVFSYSPNNNGISSPVAVGKEGAAVTNITFMNNLVVFGTNSCGPSGLFIKTVPGGNGWVTNSTFTFNDFFSGDTSQKVVFQDNGETFINCTTPVMSYTVSGYSPKPGTTFTNNVELNPAFTGGGLPTGLDATYRPNSNYFLPLKGSVPLPVAKTLNTINGDSVHGYSSNPAKFATDISGVPRSNWTMGAYEVGVSTPGIYGTWTKAVTNWTATSIPVTVPAGNSIVFVGGYCLQALSSGNPGWTIGGGIVGATNYFKSTGSTNFGLLQLTSAPFTTTTNIPNASVQINGFGQVSDHNTAAFIVCIMTNTPYPITPLVDGVAMTYLQFPATASSETATPVSQPGDLMFDIIVTPSNPFTNAPGQTFVASVPNGTATLRGSWAVATSTSTPMTWTGTADTLSHIAVAISQRKSTAYVTNLRMQQ